MEHLFLMYANILNSFKSILFEIKSGFESTDYCSIRTSHLYKLTEYLVNKMVPT